MGLIRIEATRTILIGARTSTLAVPPPSLPPDSGPAFELHIETGEHQMPCSRPMKRWSQGELDDCHKQVAILLNQGWILLSSTTLHAASVAFARKADGT